MIKRLPVYLGFSPDEWEAACVAEASLRSVSGASVAAARLSRMSLQGFYRRPTSERDGQRWDDLSDAPMSTDHAIARFFVPWLRGYAGWALFADSDVVFRRDVVQLFELADDRYAVMCVKHALPAQGTVTGEKKDGAIQTAYPRKNWSSVMLFNCAHLSNKWLTLDRLNEVPGRDLHRFCWLVDDEIGELDPKWNWLVNVSAPIDDPAGPAIVHYTLGTPNIDGHQYDPFADEWYRWAGVAGYKLDRPVREPLTAIGG